MGQIPLLERRPSAAASGRRPQLRAVLDLKEYVMGSRPRTGVSTMRTVICAILVLATVGFVSMKAVGDDAGAGVHTHLLSHQNGDVNADGDVDLTDVINLLDWLYRGGPPPRLLACGPANKVENGDINGDGAIDLTDLIVLIDFLYRGGPPPVQACPQPSA